MSCPSRLLPLCKKTKLCRFNERGECTRGANCTFAHSDAEIKPTPNLSKTKMCPALLSKGECRRQDLCSFAHSKAELRSFTANDEQRESNKDAKRNLLLLNLCTPGPSSETVPQSIPSDCTGTLCGNGFSQQVPLVDQMMMHTGNAFSRQTTPGEATWQTVPLNHAALGNAQTFSRQTSPMYAIQQMSAVDLNSLGNAQTFSRQMSPMNIIQPMNPVDLSRLQAFSRQTTPMENAQHVGSVDCSGLGNVHAFGRQLTPVDNIQPVSTTDFSGMGKVVANGFSQHTMPQDRSKLCIPQSMPYPSVTLAPSLQPSTCASADAAAGFGNPGLSPPIPGGVFAVVCHPGTFSRQTTQGSDGFGPQATLVEGCERQHAGAQASPRKVVREDGSAAQRQNMHGSGAETKAFSVERKDMMDGARPDESAFADAFGRDAPSFSRHATPADSELSAPLAASGGFDRQLSGQSSISVVSTSSSRNMFHKTRMCTFHQTGRCRKNKHCNFAHGPEELRPLMDLSCTKMCPALLSSGKCEARDCRYAHCKEEMRPQPLVKEKNNTGIGDSPGDSPGDTSGDSPGDSTQTTATPSECLSDNVSAMTLKEEQNPKMIQRVCVKNTFLTVDTQVLTDDARFMMMTAPIPQRRTIEDMFPESDEEAAQDGQFTDTNLETHDNSSVSAGDSSEGMSSLLSEGLGFDFSRRLRVKNTFLDLEECNEEPALPRRRSTGNCQLEGHHLSDSDFSKSLTPSNCTTRQQQAVDDVTVLTSETPPAPSGRTEKPEGAEADAPPAALTISEPAAQLPMARGTMRDVPRLPSVSLSLPSLRSPI